MIVISNEFQFSIKSEDLAYWISIIFFCLMCILFIIDIVEESSVLLKYKLYSLTPAGILGVLAASTFGWYASKKGRPYATAAEHIILTTGFTFITIILYLAALTVAKLIFP